MLHLYVCASYLKTGCLYLSTIVQEPVTRTVPKKKKCKRAKWLYEEALQIAEKRRGEKDKEERERYTQLNAELQRAARERRKPS